MNADKPGRGPGHRPGSEALGQRILCSVPICQDTPILIITIHPIPKALILAHGAGISPWLTIQRTTPNLPPSPDGDETPSARIYIMLTIKSYL